MRSTKAESLIETAETTMGKVDAAVLAQVKALGPACREALVRASGIKTSTMCGALDRLTRAGAVRKAAERVYNPETKRNVLAYEVVT